MASSRMASSGGSDVRAGHVVGGRLVLDDRVVPGRIGVEEGRIVRVELADAERHGPLIAPGFVDAHVHGWGGHAAMGGRESIRAMARALLRRGVTSFLPTAVSAPIEALADFAESVRGLEAPLDGAVPLGFHLEGPFLAPSRAGVHDPRALRIPADVPAHELTSLFDGLRIVTIAPELPGSLDLIRRLAEAGVVASLGHSDASAPEADAGYAAGATGTTHLFNAMSGLAHRSPGLAAAALTTDGAWVELIADGVHVDPRLWPLVLRAKPADRVVLVSDAVPLGGAGDGRTRLGAIEVEVRGGRATAAGTGTIAGSTIALDDAVRNLALAGVPLPAAVAAASRNPATLLGLPDRGRIAEGMRADLVELGDRLDVRRVALNGAWIDVPAG